MRALTCFFTAFLLLSCGNIATEVHPIELIAHAGGEVGGYGYTNSREALERAVADGFRYIEFDLQYTADSVLVAAHAWEEFNAATGYPHKGDSAPTLVEFTKRRLHGLYTPLTAVEINSFFEKEPSLLLVTDKISTPAVLAEYFPALKERMVVEAFSYPDYAALVEQGYRRVLYSCLATDLGEALVKHLLLHPFFKGRKIEWITMYAGELDNMLFRLVDALSSFKMALFTINDYDEIPAAHRAKTRMIYTERVKP